MLLLAGFLCFIMKIFWKYAGLELDVAITKIFIKIVPRSCQDLAIKSTKGRATRGNIYTQLRFLDLFLFPPPPKCLKVNFPKNFSLA